MYKSGRVRKKRRTGLSVAGAIFRPNVFCILFLFLSSCSFRDYTNEIKQLDSAEAILASVQIQLHGIDTAAYLSKVQSYRKQLDSLKQFQSEHDTLALVLRSQYLREGKTCIAIVQETRRMAREATIISEQIKKLREDFDKHAYDEQSAGEYVRSETESAKRLEASLKKFLKAIHSDQ